MSAFVIPRQGLYFPGHGLLLPDEDGQGVLMPDPYRTPMDVLRRIWKDERGVFSASGLYVDNFIDVLDATQLAIDTSLTSHKIALFLNALTPDYSANVDFSLTPYDANQSSGAGYTAGGQVVVSPTTTESPAGSLMYDLGDQIWASPTSVTARGAIEYADALVNNNLIVGITFGSDFVSTAGTFTIQWNSLGVFAIDLA